ncbi:hypothetical protein BJ322DRAFT_1082673 [Thelephora terrestris]|uniref:Uncharacterized protein n=1 Tax=Thelephora terrestris TaxID=56493 RepID=A0A9P6H9G3_9AGAM|nr:hypothetical protein BJ322DRAFT_1082673 [Thelephora terrestris]
MMHANAARLFETARTFSQIDLGVTVRRAYDTFREQISVVILECVLDLTLSCLGTDTSLTRHRQSTSISPEETDPTLNPNSEAPKALSEVDSPMRLDYVFLYHTR